MSLTVPVASSFVELLDDTLPLSAEIQRPHNVNRHIEYCIKVRRKYVKDREWTVFRRYNDFVSLCSALGDSGINLPLPPKRAIGNMKPEFVAERQRALQELLNSILSQTILASTLSVKLFLDPKNYRDIVDDIVLQNVSMALRGNDSYKIKGRLPKVGWRIRKHYFLVSNSSETEEWILSWQSYGPYRALSEDNTVIVFKHLMNLNHPFIDKSFIIRSCRSGAYAIRKLHPSGSVKDLIYGTRFRESYLSKYANPKQIKPFTAGQIAHYGYQILQVLKYLHDRGLYYGHLHTGNIAIENQRILLLDIENSVCGVPSYLRSIMIAHSKLNKPEAIEVYMFGHTLYEMAFGNTLTVPTCDEFPSVNAELVAVLKLILSMETSKRGLPTIESVMNQPFFKNNSSISDYELDVNLKNGSSKVTSQCSELYKSIRETVTTRLNRDYKTIKAEKKQAKIHDILNSDSSSVKYKKKNVSNEGRSAGKSTINNDMDNELSPTNLSMSSEKSESGGSSISTLSSSTSHIDQRPKNSEIISQDQNRSALLNSICSFNKSKLTRVVK